MHVKFHCVGGPAPEEYWSKWQKAENPKFFERLGMQVNTNHKINNLIEKEIETLPNQLKKEVLDFIGYLKKKTAEKRFKFEKLEWSKFSLANALRGMENEEGPEYSEADLKEKWS